MNAPSYPLAAAVVRDVLAQRLPGVTSYVTVPRDHPDRYVHVVSRGGTRRRHGHLSDRMLQIYGYGPTAGVAADLCERAVTAIVGAGMDPSEQRIRRCTVAGEPADYSDPDSGSPRATATVVVLLRGATF